MARKNVSKEKEPERITSDASVPVSGTVVSRILPEEKEPEVEKVSGVPVGDYLKKYESPYHSVQVGSKAHAMKMRLLSQPAVSFFVPLKDGEDPSVKQICTMNGYHLLFPKGEYLDVPKQVAEFLIDSLKQTNKALAQFRMDKSKDKESALS